MLKDYAVAQSNPTTKGTFVTKLVCETKINHPIFGEKSKKETYYISGTKQLGAGEVIKLDVDKEFNVIERPYENPDNGEVVMLKWLSIK